MMGWGWTVLAGAVAGLIGCAQPAIACVDDPRSYLALSYESFDQGVAPSEDGGPRREWGWREVARKTGCTMTAADLIRDYRLEHRESLPDRQRLFLAFHEGQMAASGGDVARALPLIESGAMCCQGETWAIYAEAIIAFLRDDRQGLLDARRRLLAVPEPENWSEAQRAYKEQFDQEMRWPMNIEATDMLVACFGRRYPGGIPGGCGLDE